MNRKLLRYETEIRIDPASVTKLNPQFSLCDILVCYHGDNRNRTAFSKSVIEDALFSLYGVPIVGEWIYKQDGTDEKTWGSHGGKIIIDDNGIRFEQTTKPLGFVTKDAVDHAKWVEVIEKDGFTKHEYLSLSGCVLWTERVPETKSILDKNYGQSMEVELLEGKMREDGIYEVNKMIFSALCVLGTAQPCFESASIGRHYTQDEIHSQVSAMMKEYEKYSQKNQKEECKEMKKKVISALKEFTYQDINDKQAPRFAILDIREDELDVLDRTDYTPYTLPYTISENETVSFDLDKKTQKSIGAVETKNEFHLKTEIDAVSAQKVSAAVVSYESAEIERLNEKFNQTTEQFSKLQLEYNKAKEKLDEYARAEKEAEQVRHRQEIDAKMDEYSSRMGTFSEYLVYRSQVDYSKTVEQVDIDMLVLLGTYNKKKPATFSYTPTVLSVDSTTGQFESSIGGGRYGDLIDKVKNRK